MTTNHEAVIEALATYNQAVAAEAQAATTFGRNRKAMAPFYLAANEAEAALAAAIEACPIDTSADAKQEGLF